MKHRIVIDDNLMMVLDEENNGHDAFAIDTDQPWLAVAELWSMSQRYNLDAIESLDELHAYLEACR